MSASGIDSVWEFDGLQNAALLTAATIAIALVVAACCWPADDEDEDHWAGDHIDDDATPGTEPKP